MLQELLSSVLIEDVGYVRAAEDAHCKEEHRDESREDSEDDEDFVVQLE